MRDVKEFEVRDKVWNPRKGKGVVVKVDPSTSSPYPVLVDFDGKLNSYTRDGKEFDSDPNPTLFYGHDCKIIDEVVPFTAPESVFVNVYTDMDNVLHPNKYLAEKMRAPGGTTMEYVKKV